MSSSAGDALQELEGEGALYGLLAIAMALFIGWAGTAIVRRT